MEENEITTIINEKTDAIKYAYKDTLGSVIINYIRILTLFPSFVNSIAQIRI